MRCIVTAGPTYEPLDAVRRLTNFSTGRLGTELAAALHTKGHEVVLLIGEQSTWRGKRVATSVQPFSTTEDLLRRLESLSHGEAGAVFHAAAVSDFRFGRVTVQDASDSHLELTFNKISTRLGPLNVELVPTPKLIAQLRLLFTRSFLVGWKFEADGTREDVIARAVHQLRENKTQLCVANGPAYGAGFGVVDTDGRCVHLHDRESLFEKLIKTIEDL